MVKQYTIEEYRKMWDEPNDSFNKLEDALIAEAAKHQLHAEAGKDWNVNIIMHRDSEAIVTELCKMYVARQDDACYEGDKEELDNVLKMGMSQRWNELIATNVFDCAFGRVDWGATNDENVVYWQGDR